MVELLVVIVIMTILISSVMVASSLVITKSRTTNTQALLQVVSDAVEEFKREQTAHPTIARASQDAAGGGKVKVRYMKRYGYYPPDELEVFTGAGLPGSAPTGAYSLAVKPAVMHPPPPYNPMRFYGDGTAEDAKEHRDLAAMIVAIETLGDTSSSILDRIPDGNRTAGVLDATGDPAQFLDRNNNGKWDQGEDHQIRYIIDAWDNPISYLAQRDWDPDDEPAASTNHASWNKVSTQIIRLNGGQPVIMSYGPDGEDQLTMGAMLNTGEASLVGDFGMTNPVEDVLDNPMNADNVYSDPSLKEKLGRGIVE